MNAYRKTNVRQGIIYCTVAGSIVGIISVFGQLSSRVGSDSSARLGYTSVCLFTVVIPLAIGWLTTRWADRINAQDALVEGAVATAIGTFASGLISLCAATIAQLVVQIRGTAAYSMALGILSEGIGNLIIQPIVGTIFGAIGGLLAAATLRDQEAPSRINTKGRRTKRAADASPKSRSKNKLSNGSRR